nr:hypothetical protein [uncultured Treponema sp.]
MKKIVGTIAAIALAASSAFAGVGIGSWGRALWAPVQGDKNGVSTWEGISWFGDDSRVGISIHGESENVGFNIDMNGDKGGIGAGDTQFIWVKPWSFLELQVGKVQDNTLRGDGCFGAFNWLRNSKMAGLGEDLTFKRIGDGTGSQVMGAIVKVTPVDGLLIEAALKADGSKVEDIFKVGQYAAGYDIAGVGLIRAQYIGATKTVNAAFDLKAVDGLALSVGAFIPTESGKTMDINAYAAYGFGMVKAHALVAVGITDSKADITAGVGADFDFGNGIGATADVRFNIANDANSISFLAGVTKGFSNGLIGLGFQGVTQSKAKVGDIPGAAGKDFLFDGDSTFAWQIPVRVEYWF